MQHLLSRNELVSRVEQSLRRRPVTVLLGARQVGKTTLAGLVSKRRDDVTVFDLERAAAQEALSRTPELTLSGTKGLVVIDEVQRLPKLFNVLRPLCDDPGRKATFLLLGSASPTLIRGMSQTLAGRAHFIDISGFSLAEVGAESQNRLWVRGGFPPAYLAESEPAAWEWLEDFARTFLERDIPQFGLRVPATTLRRFWTMLAHYHGQKWNASELATSMSVSYHTAVHYRDILAGAFMVRVLPPWFENLKKRQVKSPKVYLRDTGLLHWHLGIESMAALRAHPRYGASWEGFALEQVLIRVGDRDAYFWGTQRGAELDLLFFSRGKRWGFEFKCSDAPSMTKSMHTALTDLSLERLWVLYPGKTGYPLHERAEAVPLVDLDRIAQQILSS